MFFPSAIKPYLDLCRISNLPSIWTNVLCAFMLANGQFVPVPYFVLGVSLSFFYLAGMCLNDICDAGYDRVYRPSRPIPSGRVSMAGAVALSAALLATGFLLLAFLPYRQGLFAALLLLAAIIWYDLHHKKNPLSVLLMASCRFLVFAVTALASTGTFSPQVISAGGIQFIYVIGISLVARHENSRQEPFAWPVIPLMLTGICILDGILLSLFVSPVWLVAGLGGALLMSLGQTFVRGD